MTVTRWIASLAAGLLVAAPLAGTAEVAHARGNALGASLAGLIDQHGRPVTADRFDRHIVLLNFIFTRCGSTCPTQTADLVRFDRSLPPAIRARVRLVSVSVDPANDTPQALRRYAEAMGADQRRWSFLTGPRDRIAQVTRAYSAFKPGDAVGTGFHTSDLRLFDGHARMIQRYAGAPLAARHLRDDVLTVASLDP